MQSDTILLSAPRPDARRLVRRAALALGALGVGAVVLRGRHPLRALAGLAGTALLARAALAPARFRGQRFVLVNRPPEALYSFVLVPENLPRFLPFVRAVTRVGEHRTRWTFAGRRGRGPVAWDAEVVRTVPEALVVWRSAPGSALDLSAAAAFERLENHRGTCVRVTYDFAPRGGRLSLWLDRLRGRDPGDDLARGLAKLKAVMEDREDPRMAEAIRAGDARFDPENEFDIVLDGSEESFPASDPPAWMSASLTRSR